MSRLDTSSLARFTKALKTLPRSLAQNVAAKAAPEITKWENETFDSCADPYGVPWAPGADGKKVDLVESGDLRKFIKYVSVGTKLRVALGVPYAKYQIGKRPVYPKQGDILPAKYQETLARISAETAEEHVIRGGT